MSLLYSLEVVNKALDAKKEATEYLLPYLTQWFDLQGEIEKHFDHTEADAEYEFHGADATHVLFYTEDWTDRYGDWKGDHVVGVPYQFIQNPQKYIEETREKIALRKAVNEAKERERQEIHIAYLRRQLEVAERSLASTDPIKATANANAADRIRTELEAAL